MSRLLQIRASAGSGKTYTLTRSYVEKLAQAGKVLNTGLFARAASEILAVTFTNAAANEMRERVLARLKRAALDGKDELLPREVAKSWLAALLQDLDALNIRTIDSLLHQIIRASALDLGINPEYETIFDAKEALKPYVELFLEKAAESGPERELLRKACESLLKSGKAAFGSKGVLLKNLEASLENTLNGNFASALDTSGFLALKARVDATVQERAQILLQEAKALTPGLQKTYLNKIQAYAAGKPPKNPGALLGLETDPARLFQKDSGISATCQAAYEDFRQAANLLHEFIALEDDIARWEPFVRLAKSVGDIFRQMQLEDAILPQAVVPSRAKSVLDPLGAVSDAVCRMGNRLRHFLVDEFQDTSNEQWAVLRTLALEALANGGSLTWVGDPKQSIYSWRGGNHQLFDAAKRDPELLSIEPNPKTDTLDANWRSSPQIVRHTNAFFKPLANIETARKVLATMVSRETEKSHIQTAAAQLAGIFADVEQSCAHPDAQEGYICCEKIEVAKTAELKPAILQKLLDLLTQLGQRRPLSDILILARGNDLAAAIAKYLGNLDIPVLTENGLLLNEHFLLNQTVAFLEFLNNPGDDLAFWTVLNSNLFFDHPEAAGLTAANLADLAIRREELANGGRESLCQAFARAFPELWQKFFVPFLDLASIYTPYDTVMEWYAYLDVARRYPEDKTMLRRFMEVLHLAENRGYATIADFLEFWQNGGKKEKAPMPAKMEAVRIMTIHKAKGLQAPVTILPDTCFALNDSNGPEALEIQGKTVVAKVRAGHARFYQNARLKQALEELNLLYVAMTRAKEELYLFQTSVKQAGNRKSTAKAFAMLADNVAEKMPYPIGSPPACAKKAAAPRPAAPVGKAQASLKKGWRPMQWQPRLKIYHTKKREPGLTANERGTLLHAALENLAGNSAAAVRVALLSAQRATGIIAPATELPGLYETLEWFAGLPKASFWLKSAHREQSIISVTGEIFRPDLLVPEPEGPLVIDYKSGQPAAEHLEQMAVYLKNLDSAGQFAGKPRGLLVYLDQRQFLKIGLDGPGELSGIY